MMTQQPDWRSRLKPLLIALTDGSIDADQRAELAALLDAHEDARREYLEFMRLHALLLWRAGASQPIEPPQACESLLLSVLEEEQRLRAQRRARLVQEAARQPDEDRDRHERLLMLLGEREKLTPVRHIVISRSAVYAAAAAVVALVVALVWRQPTPPVVSPQPTVVVKPEFVQVATLVEQVGAEWAAASHRLTVGGPVYNEPLELRQGYARLRFTNGAEVLVQGPASFEPVGVDALQLTLGRLVGTCDTPQSRGFTVRTPHGGVVDLGTEFAVVAREGDTDIHVFDGLVEVVSREDAPRVRRRLTRGQAVRTTGAVIRDIPVDDRAFARRMPHPYELTVARSAPLAYWKLDDEPHHTSVYDQGRLGAHGTVRGEVKLGEPGAIAESKAARFDGDSGYIDVGVHPALNLTRNFSIEMWVHMPERRDAFGRFLSNRSALGGFGVGVDLRSDEPNHGSLWFSFFSGGAGDYASDITLPVGRWVHLVWTVDAQHQPTLYVNGEKQRLHPVRSVDHMAGRPSDQPLYLGRNPFDALGEQAWWGSLQHVAIYDYALPAHVILEHFRSSLAGPSDPVSR